MKVLVIELREKKVKRKGKDRKGKEKKGRRRKVKVDTHSTWWREHSSNGYNHIYSYPHLQNKQ